MVSLETAVQILNDLLKADPIAINELFQYKRVSVNKKVCDHPTIQVSGGSREAGTGNLGILGILNGLVACDNVIVMELDEPLGKIERFVIGRMDNGKVVIDDE